MSDNPLGHLTVRQLEAAEDYLGCTLDQADQAPKLRLAVIGAWARLLRDNPDTALESVRDLSFDRIQKLSDDSGAAGLGES